MSISSLRSPAVFAALALIALATLTPGSGPGGWGLGVSDPADLLVNIALFVPLGMAVRRRARQASPLRLRFDPPEPVAHATSSAEPEARASGQETPAKHPSRRFGTGASPLRTIVVAAFLLSLSIELAQLSLIPGRDSSPWDLAANVSGAVLGAGLPAHLLVLPLIPAWLLSGWLLAPTPPPTPIWWGQWAHQFGSPAPFSGTIRAAELNGVPAPDHSLGESATAQMKAGFARPPLEYRVRLDPPTNPSPVRTQVAGVADGVGGEVVGWWQIGWDLELSWYARGTRLGLRSPSLRLPGLLFLDPGREVALAARLQPTRVRLIIGDDLHDEQHGLVLGPWQGWRLFWPLDPPGPGWAWLLSVLWTGVCLGLPVALWVAWRRKK